MPLFDAHAHLSSSEVYPDIEEVMTRAKEAGVDKVVNICTDKLSLERGLELARRFEGIYNTAATTPHDVHEDGEGFFPIVEQKVDQLVAIGETGLDYYYEHSAKKLQQQFLSRYFALAQKVNLPIVFHCREAFSDLFAMADEQFSGKQAVLHCFTGTREEARGCLDRGWLVSFSGIITFKNSEALRDVVKYVPLDRLLIETDSPYLAPQRRRGKQNEPGFIVETVEKIAELKGVSLDKAAAVTCENANAFFRLDKR